MTETKSILVPFAYRAYGIARRDRSAKLHLVLDALPVLVPVLDSQGSIAIRSLNFEADLPVCGRRVGRPAFERGSVAGSGLRQTDGLDEADWAARWIERIRKGHPPERFELPLVPMDDLAGCADALGPDDLKSIEWSDRNGRHDAFRSAARSLALIDGRACRFGDELLLRCRMVEGRPSATNAVFASELRQRLARSAHPVLRGYEDGPFLRPDEYRRACDPDGTFSIEGPVDDVDWTVSSREAGTAALLASSLDSTVGEFAPTRTGSLLRLAHEAAGAVLGYAHDGILDAGAEDLVDALDATLRAAAPSERRGYSGVVDRIAICRSFVEAGLHREPAATGEVDPELAGFSM